MEVWNTPTSDAPLWQKCHCIDIRYVSETDTGGIPIRPYWRVSGEKKSLFLFRYSLDMPGIHPRYGEYQSDTREVKKKKGENLTPGWSLTINLPSWVKSPNLVSPCLYLSLSLSVFSFLHFASCLFWLKVLGFYIYIFGYFLLWVCDINYNHIVIDKIINVILFVVQYCL